MTAAELAQSAQNDDEVPVGISIAQKALWLAKAGRWDDSHDLCEDFLIFLMRYIGISKVCFLTRAPSHKRPMALAILCN